MTLEEKLENISQAAIEDATQQSEALIQEYQQDINKVIKIHEEEIQKRNIAEYEYQYAKMEREKNKAISQAMLESKMTIAKKTQELSDKLFELVKTKLSAYKQTPEYESYLLKLIQSAIDFSNGNEIMIYIDPSDASLKEALEKKSGKTITISTEEFFGGIRAIITEKNILIDESFATKISEEKEQKSGGILSC
ncbi:MAG: V-type ATP synthase subunit E [Lachnospiraceae bacterium]|nr:V-type ATP synthase subunit E [Lachnospiraceae bacterium]